MIWAHWHSSCKASTSGWLGKSHSSCHVVMLWRCSTWILGRTKMTHCRCLGIVPVKCEKLCVKQTKNQLSYRRCYVGNSLVDICIPRGVWDKAAISIYWCSNRKQEKGREDMMMERNHHFIKTSSNYWFLMAWIWNDGVRVLVFMNNGWDHQDHQDIYL